MIFDWGNRDFADQYSRIRGAKFSLLYPDLIDRLKRQRPKRLLDYSCGSGSFLGEFAVELNVEQFGYDPEETWRAAARQNCLTAKNTTIVSSLDVIETGSIGAVTAIFSWMAWKSDEECVRNLRGIHRVLNKEGLFYAVVTHPCFRDRDYSSNSPSMDMTHYLNSGTSYQVVVKDGNIQVNVTNYHWPLSAMSSQLKQAGLYIDVQDEYPDVVQGAKGSPWLLLVAAPR